MIKIRLKRYGRKQRPSYRIVAMDSRVKRDGKAIEELGFYNPLTDETHLKFEPIIKRLKQGGDSFVADPVFPMAILFFMSRRDSRVHKLLPKIQCHKTFR